MRGSASGPLMNGSVGDHSIGSLSPIVGHFVSPMLARPWPSALTADGVLVHDKAIVRRPLPGNSRSRPHSPDRSDRFGGRCHPHSSSPHTGCHPHPSSPYTGWPPHSSSPYTGWHPHSSSPHTGWPPHSSSLHIGQRNGGYWEVHSRRRVYLQLRAK